jgi:hypothetical protein
MSIKLIDLLRELSATGTGATAVPGEGEGMATKYAFAGPGGSKTKKKKGLIVKKDIKEADEIPASFDDRQARLYKTFKYSKENPNARSTSDRPGRPNIPDAQKKGQPENPYSKSSEKSDENLKSSFEDGKVHIIHYTPSTQSSKSKKEELEIYRKITKSEYDELKTKYKWISFVYPTNDIEHYKDIYYVDLPESTYSKRIVGSKAKIIPYYIYLSLEDFNTINEKIGKIVKFELAPLKDIIDNTVNRIKIDKTSLDQVIHIDDFKKGQAMVDRQKSLANKKEPEDSAPKKLTKFSTIRSGADYARIILNQDREKTAINKSKSELKGLQGEQLAKKIKSLLTIELRKDGLDKEEIEMKFDDPVFIQNVLTPVQKYANIPINEATAELQSLPSGNDPVSIAKKAFILLKNQLFGLTFDECLEDPTTISNLLDKMEKVKNSIKNEQKKIIDDDIYEELENVIVGISSMQNITDDLKKAFEQANKSDFNINYNK